MTLRDMNLRVFEGEPVPHVFFQPRVEPWHAWHSTFGRLPERYRDFSLQEFVDDLNVSMRYVHYYTGMPDPVVTSYSAQVAVHESFGDREGLRVFRTPRGDLVETFRRTPDEVWRKVSFSVTKVNDLRKLRWLHENTDYSFSLDNCRTGDEFIAHRGEPQFWVPKSPYQALAQVWMKFEDFVFSLKDCPHEVEDVMDAIDRSYDRLYEELASAGVVRIINFGENIHDHLLSPDYFERYLIPFYEKRSSQLRNAGIYTYIHIDGYFRSLLKYLRDLPFDALEALTPLPQGDVSLEEIAEAIGGKILIDGIPAVLFLPPYTREELMRTVEKTVDLFHPRLVLGASDEVPEGGGEEAAERVRMVSEWCAAHP